MKRRRAAPRGRDSFSGLAVAGITAIAGASTVAGFTTLAVFASADFARTAEALIALSVYAHVALFFHYSVD